MSYKFQYQVEEPFFPDFHNGLAFAKNEIWEGSDYINMAKVIPWADIEALVAPHLKKLGRRQLSVRCQLGLLLAQNMEGCSDRTLIRYTIENHYLRIFLGLDEYGNEPPCCYSLIHFIRVRFEPFMAEIQNLINQKYQAAIKFVEPESLERTTEKFKQLNIEKQSINDIQSNDIANNQKSTDVCAPSNVDEEDNKRTGHASEPPTTDTKIPNKGTMLIDATVSPADIAYPTDWRLIYDSFRVLHHVICELREQHFHFKERFNAQVFRKHYLKIAKAKKITTEKKREELRYMLLFLSRAVKAFSSIPKDLLNKYIRKSTIFKCDTAVKIYEQQQAMWNDKSSTITNRIVSLNQPWVRPIIRGKSRAKIEFGMKVDVAMVNGVTYVDRLSYDAYSEGNDLIRFIENYKIRFGFWPERVRVDQGYQTEQNRQFCIERNIILCGKPLGRKQKNKTQQNLSDQDIADELRGRIPIEGKFGEAKRNYTLDRLMSHTPATSYTTVYAIFILMDIKKWVRLFFVSFSKVVFYDMLEIWHWILSRVHIKLPKNASF